MSGFTPTCPRCDRLCDVGSRYCCECGCRLYPTQAELDELRVDAVRSMYDDLLARVRGLEPL